LQSRHRKTRKRWLTTAVVSLVAPWTLHLTAPSGTLPDPLPPAVLWKALWPVLLGAVFAIALPRWWRSMPRIPKSDIIGTGWRNADGCHVGRDAGTDDQRSSSVADGQRVV
jgi:hypothetical protein